MSRPSWQPRNRLGYEQSAVSRRDIQAQKWTSAAPAGPVRRVSPEEIARMERERADRQERRR